MGGGRGLLKGARPAPASNPLVEQRGGLRESLRCGPAAWPGRDCCRWGFRCCCCCRCFRRCCRSRQATDWRCDGHPDCEDDGDEWGCGTATTAEPRPGGPAVTPPRSSAVPLAGSAEPSATPEPEVSVPSRSQGYTWILIVAELLVILVAAGSVAVWGLSKAKCRSDTFSLEKVSREQLMSDESQKGSLP
ncbi:PREDICTED: CD320 antigen [Sturnus vulgaris]|uniref:CD320 antigen n=1 Tax=Sturnus vulgaris TaxID=9172 RepID=UPI00071A64AE|nr:PREDICTED: CD320 antigen [Sturnus vulgaris]